MEKTGIIPVNWHPSLYVLPQTEKTPCVRVWLLTDGHIKDIELLNQELAVHLRKYEPDNGRSLPGFNVRPPYRLVMPDEEGKKTIKSIEKSLQKGGFNFSSYLREEDDFWTKTRDGLKQCFGTVRDKLDAACRDGGLLADETLDRFLRVVKKLSGNEQRFQQEYCSIIRNKVERGDFPLSLLCYSVNEDKQHKEDSDSRASVPKFSTFLDVVDYKDDPVAHEKTIARLNVLLNASGAVPDSATDIAGKDAYGRDIRQKHEHFPQVALPVLGGVKLRSQVDKVPAQRRYHRSESETFPVGSESRKRVKAALEWLGAAGRDGKTNGTAGDKELLFAYPRTQLQDSIPLAKMFGAQLEDALKEDTFERLAESVIEQLKGLGTPAKDAELEIFSLRKMDKARTKLVYYRNTTVESLEVASKSWQRGCQNIPAMHLQGWGKKDEQTQKRRRVPIEGAVVFPVKLHMYLNLVWKRDGVQAGKVKIFAPADGMNLLLETQSRALAMHMLERLMRHAHGYFFYLCRCTGKKEIANVRYKEFYPGILGLLLFKLGKNMEEFMKESAFLLGRFLRVTDEIHRLYCEVVRKGDLPSELCGSSLLVSMLQSPEMTLDQLAMRSAPYVKWARTGRDKDDKSGLVGYWMNLWGDVAEQLHEKNLPKHLSVAERAQVFLGYLALTPKKGK
jgi:hypothetical protein